MNNKVMIAIVALVVLVGGVLYMKGSSTEQTLPPTTGDVVQDNTAAPAATGNVDDIITALDSEDSQEATMVQAGDADAETAVSDENIISNVSQSYDETAL